MTTSSDAPDGRYPPIGEYALLGDCHAAALVSRRGSIDWCCMPRMDDGTAFGRILDWDRGGYCLVGATDRGAVSTRSYLDGTLVLETTLRTSEGEARVLDCFTTHEGGSADPYRQLLRIVEGVQGEIELRVDVVARFDYGATKPWVRSHRPQIWTAVGGDDALVISGDLDLAIEDRHDLRARLTMRSGQRARLSVVACRPEQIDPDPPPQPDAAELDDRLTRTIAWWRAWSRRLNTDGQDGPQVRRSAIVLKALTNAPTGAIAAAPTTSLPEAVGGRRNWDYRFSWLRDSQFTVRSLVALGCESEADGLRRFIERTAAGSPADLQVMYGLDGRRRLFELELPLEGYRRSTPVRIGNAASVQLQLDVYGELLDLAWRWHQRGHSPDDDYWRFLLDIVQVVTERWPEADHGLWEMRGTPRHHVHSKVLCWAALDRGLRLAEACLRTAPRRRWQRVRDDIRVDIEANGIDRDRDVFVQCYGSTDLDASALLIPSVEFIAYDDPRMVATTDAVASDLDDSGLLRRYRSADGVGGGEGVFVACTFWLAECYARQHRTELARAAYERAASTANDLGLYAEEHDPRHHLALGNFPQGLSHLSHIAAAVALAEETAP